MIEGDWYPHEIGYLQNSTETEIEIHNLNPQLVAIVL